MRNLKKILALVLALVMSFSLVTTAGAFSDDGDITADYNDAIKVLNGLDVFKGYDNGATFQPKGNITRAEVAAIIYRIATGDVTDSQKDIYSSYGQFTDVLDGSWYAGYVNYCANAGYIKGRGNKIFDPQGQVTGYEALAMILRAIGYDKNSEFTGSNWQVRTASIANERGITKHVTSTQLGQAATREVVAEILFRSILANKVNFNANTLSYNQTTSSLGYDTFKLEEVTGVVVANEFADLYDTDVLANGKTDLEVKAGDIRHLNYTSELTDIGESRHAYIAQSKVLHLGDTGTNTVFETGAKLDISTDKKFEDESKLKKTDDTEFYVNFGHAADWQSDWRIRYEFKASVNKGTLTKAEALEAIKKAVEYFTVPDDASTAMISETTRRVDGRDIELWTLTYTHTFKIDDRITSVHQDNIKEIFNIADKRDDVVGAYEEGEVYVGTSSVKDISDELSFKQFKQEYIKEDNYDRSWEESDNGEWVKIVDNNADGKAEYAFLTEYWLDKAIHSRTKDGETVLEYNYLDDDDYDFRYLNDVVINDVVLYTLIDGQALIQKAESVEKSVNYVSFKDEIIRTTDGDEYGQSGIFNKTTMDQLIVNMDENVAYKLYFDKYGYVRAYELVEKTPYGLLTELYWGKYDNNGRFIKNSDLTVELKGGKAKIEEYDVSNDETVFEGKSWSELGETYKDYLLSDDRYGSVSDRIVLQPATAHLGLVDRRNDHDYNEDLYFAPAMTNVAKYVISDKEVKLTSAAEYAYNEDGQRLYYHETSNHSWTKNTNENGGIPVYAVDYIELDGTNGLSADQRVYDIRVGTGNHNNVHNVTLLNKSVYAAHDTEYYIAGNNNKEIEYFADYTNLPKIEKVNGVSPIRAMYAVARNTSNDSETNDYWVADVVVIEVDDWYSAEHSISFAFYNENQETSRNTKRINTLNNKSDNPELTLVPDYSWGKAWKDYGFYTVYDAEMDGSELVADRIGKISTNGRHYSDYKIWAGQIRHINATGDRGDYMAVNLLTTDKDRDDVGIKDTDFYSIDVTRKSSSNALYEAESLHAPYGNAKGDFDRGDYVIWIENGDGDAIFAVIVSLEDSKGVQKSPNWLYNQDNIYDVNTLFGEILEDQSTNKVPAAITNAQTLVNSNPAMNNQSLKDLKDALNALNKLGDEDKETYKTEIEDLMNAIADLASKIADQIIADGNADEETKAELDGIVNGLPEENKGPVQDAADDVQDAITNKITVKVELVGGPEGAEAKVDPADVTETHKTTVTLTGTDGYHIVKVEKNGEAVEGIAADATSFDVDDITERTTIKVTLEKNDDENPDPVDSVEITVSYRVNGRDLSRTKTVTGEIKVVGEKETVELKNADLQLAGMINGTSLMATSVEEQADKFTATVDDKGNVTLTATDKFDETLAIKVIADLITGGGNWDVVENTRRARASEDDIWVKGEVTYLQGFRPCEKNKDGEVTEAFSPEGITLDWSSLKQKEDADPDFDTYEIRASIPRASVTDEQLASKKIPVGVLFAFEEVEEEPVVTGATLKIVDKDGKAFADYAKYATIRINGDNYTDGMRILANQAIVVIEEELTGLKVSYTIDGKNAAKVVTAKEAEDNAEIEIVISVVLAEKPVIKDENGKTIGKEGFTAPALMTLEEYVESFDLPANSTVVFHFVDNRTGKPVEVTAVVDNDKKFKAEITEGTAIGTGEIDGDKIWAEITAINGEVFVVGSDKATAGKLFSLSVTANNKKGVTIDPTAKENIKLGEEVKVTITPNAEQYSVKTEQFSELKYVTASADEKGVVTLVIVPTKDTPSKIEITVEVTETETWNVADIVIDEEYEGKLEVAGDKTIDLEIVDGKETTVPVNVLESEHETEDGKKLEMVPVVKEGDKEVPVEQNEDGSYNLPATVDEKTGDVVVDTKKVDLESKPVALSMKAIEDKNDSEDSAIPEAPVKGGEQITLASKTETLGGVEPEEGVKFTSAGVVYDAEGNAKRVEAYVQSADEPQLSPEMDKAGVTVEKVENSKARAATLFTWIVKIPCAEENAAVKVTVSGHTTTIEITVKFVVPSDNADLDQVKADAQKYLDDFVAYSLENNGWTHNWFDENGTGTNGTGGANFPKVTISSEVRNSVSSFKGTNFTKHLSLDEGIAEIKNMIIAAKTEEDVKSIFWYDSNAEGEAYSSMGWDVEFATSVNANAQDMRDKFGYSGNLKAYIEDEIGMMNAKQYWINKLDLNTETGVEAKKEILEAKTTESAPTADSTTGKYDNNIVSKNKINVLQEISKIATKAVDNGKAERAIAALDAYVEEYQLYYSNVKTAYDALVAILKPATSGTLTATADLTSDAIWNDSEGKLNVDKLTDLNAALDIAKRPTSAPDAKDDNKVTKLLHDLTLSDKAVVYETDAEKTTVDPETSAVSTIEFNGTGWKVSKDVTKLDMNGFNINFDKTSAEGGEKKAAIILGTANQNLEIMNSAKAGGAIVAIGDDNVKGGNNEHGGKVQGIRIEAAVGNLTIGKNVEISVTGTESYCIATLGDGSKVAVLTVEGTLKGYDGIGLNGSGDNSSSLGRIVIGGTIEASDMTIYQAANYHTILKSGSKLSGGLVGLEIVNGTLEVLKGPTVKGGGGDYGVNDIPVGGGSITNNCAIGVTPYKDGSITVNIESGATVIGKEYQIALENKEADNKIPVTITYTDDVINEEGENKGVHKDVDGNSVWKTDMGEKLATGVIPYTIKKVIETNSEKEEPNPEQASYSDEEPVEAVEAEEPEGTEAPEGTEEPDPDIENTVEG